jgi:hypothetical protein
MSLRFAKLAVFFTALHAICAMASLLFSFSTGMARFDAPTLPETYADRAASHAADFLFQPAMFVWNAVGIRNASAPLEWAVFVLNSALWGVTLGLVVVWLSRLSRKARAQVARGD